MTVYQLLDTAVTALRRHHYHHKTAAGKALFWSGAIIAIIALSLNKKKKKGDPGENITLIAGIIGIVLVFFSYIADLLFRE